MFDAFSKLGSDLKYGTVSYDGCMTGAALSWLRERTWRAVVVSVAAAAPIKRGSIVSRGQSEDSNLEGRISKGSFIWTDSGNCKLLYYLALAWRPLHLDGRPRMLSLDADGRRWTPLGAVGHANGRATISTRDLQLLAPAIKLSNILKL